jgi:hypothetical protein
MDNRLKSGALRAILLQTLKDYGRPVSAKSIWFRIQKNIPHSSQQSVADALRYMAKIGLIERSGGWGNIVYAYKPDTPIITTIAPVAQEPLPIHASNMPVKAPETPAELPKPLCVGQYTINPAGWVVADDQGVRVELFTTALEIDGLTKHPRTKKLTFDNANEMRLVRAWLSQQSGGIFSSTDALEKERDTALELAEASEARAKIAEQKLAQFRALLGQEAT